MKCVNARERLGFANIIFQELEKNYENPNHVFELYTEYFLILCKSSLDYVIFDYLESISPKMKMSEKSLTIKNRESRSRNPNKIPHPKKNEISKFLQHHYNTIKELEKDPIIRYFVTLRNITMHSVFPNLFTQEYVTIDKKPKVQNRRFQKNFIDYLLNESGGFVLKEDGYRIIVNSNDDSLFDVIPLSELEKSQRQLVEKQLENEEPIFLMKSYIEKINKFIEKFEKEF